MPATSSSPDYLSNVYAKGENSLWFNATYDAATNSTTFALPTDILSEHFFPTEDCNGEFHVYYYSLLLLSHTYFLTEFLLRCLSSKEMSLFLGEPDSMIEIFTNVPFFALWSILGKEDYNFQLFLALDTMRLLLYDRYVKYIKTELTHGITRIILYFFSLIMISSILIQYIENAYRYKTGIESGHEPNSDNVVSVYDLMLSFDFFQCFYFIMTTISVVGYGSSVESFEG